MKRATPSISFNLEDAYEKALYEHAMKEMFFSRYVKRLIDRDRNGELVQQAAPAVVDQPKAVKVSKSKASAFL